MLSITWVLVLPRDMTTDAGWRFLLSRIDCHWLSSDFIQHIYQVIKSFSMLHFSVFVLILKIWNLLLFSYLCLLVVVKCSVIKQLLDLSMKSIYLLNIYIIFLFYFRLSRHVAKITWNTLGLFDRQTLTFSIMLTILN